MVLADAEKKDTVMFSLEHFLSTLVLNRLRVISFPGECFGNLLGRYLIVPMI